MIHNRIEQYVHALFEESRDGYLTVGASYDRIEYTVDWDWKKAEELAQHCSQLVDLLTDLAGQYDKLLHGTRRLTKAQKEVWDTYLRPFPEHDMDKAALHEIFKKEAIWLLLSKEEQALSRQYNQWYEEQALLRLPWKGCSPTDLICRAQRYARLVRLNAPIAVQENEARCLAEEFVLYHCMKQ